MPVDGTRESNSGNRAYSGRLGRTASFSIAAVRWWRVPDALAIIQTKSEHAATSLWVRIGTLTVRNRRAGQVRQGYVNIRLIGSRAPLNASQRASFSHTCGP